ARFLTMVAIVKADKFKVLEAFKRKNSKVNLHQIGLEVQAEIKREEQQKQVKPTAPVAPPQAEVLSNV
ncbi:hypothetical protein, partial [Burkholderia cenocepacia]|uniref:hypothetical protein n=1 Tax=Burkholderia cenocepacia TaxID=95486 RepID=UPI001C0C7D89